MYATYAIEHETNNLTVLCVYNTHQEAVNNLRNDAETHATKNNEKIRVVNCEGEIDQDGKFLISSQEPQQEPQQEPPRVLGCVRETAVTPSLFWWNTTEVVMKQTTSYSVTEIPGQSQQTMPSIAPAIASELLQMRCLRPCTQVQPTKSDNTHASDEIMRELRACLRTRRAAVKPRSTPRQRRFP